MTQGPGRVRPGVRAVLAMSLASAVVLPAAGSTATEVVPAAASAQAGAPCAASTDTAPAPRAGGALDPPPGAGLHPLVGLFTSRPFDAAVPDQSLLTGDVAGLGAVRAADCSFVMVYSAAGRQFGLDTTGISGDALRAWWFDPHDGTAIDAGSVQRADPVAFFPPTTGPADAGRDWVLVVDDATRGYGVPGTPLRTTPLAGTPR